LNCSRLAADPAATKPRPSAAAPIRTGTITPKRSESFPIRMPPRLKPIIVSA